MKGEMSPAITDICNIGHTAPWDRRTASRSHPTAQHVLCCPLVDCGICTPYRLQQRCSNIVTIVLVIGITHSIYSNFACHLSSCMPTHTIGHNEQCPLGRHHLEIFWDDIGHIIFIVFTLAANICELCNIETELFRQLTSLP